MKSLCGTWLLLFSLGARAVLAQAPQVVPSVLAEQEFDRQITRIEVTDRFVTAIRLPEAANSVVLGDPSRFQAEHSEKEPKLVFVKAITTKASETNLLISTIAGRQISILLVSRGEAASSVRIGVDFVVSYETPRDFLVPPSAFPSAMVGETVSLETANHAPGNIAPDSEKGAGETSKLAQDLPESPLDVLLEEEESAPLPVLYGEHARYESRDGDRVRVGVGRVIDGGDEVIVLFSVVNPERQPILLMPPQVQLAGKTTTGKLIRRRKWVSARQLPVLEYRLSLRRLGPGERADGVAVFARPPYKQSNEMLLLQVAEAGAVDRPALALIGFGVSKSEEAGNDRRE